MGIFERFGNQDKKLSDFLARNAVLLDVRNPEELSQGVLPGAMHITLQDLPQQIAELKVLGRPVVAYCEVGARSKKAAQILRNEGLEAINGGGWRTLQKKL